LASQSAAQALLLRNYDDAAGACPVGQKRAAGMCGGIHSEFETVGFERRRGAPGLRLKLNKVEWRKSQMPPAKQVVSGLENIRL
jgi:hypothetical protein